MPEYDFSRNVTRYLNKSETMYKTLVLRQWALNLSLFSVVETMESDTETNTSLETLVAESEIFQGCSSYRADIMNCFWSVKAEA
jgi:hypothetical protein